MPAEAFSACQLKPMPSIALAQDGWRKLVAECMESKFRLENGLLKEI